MRGKRVSIQYREAEQRVYIEIGRFVERVVFSERLAYILGFEESSIEKSRLAQHVMDPNAGITAIYVPGLIENAVIGDTMAPVIKILPVSGRPGTIMHKEFSTPTFHRLLSKEIDSIRVELRSATGEPISFQNGVVNFVLVFKKLWIS